ncbi:MAG: cobalamin biosynthesis protein CbiA [Desulfobacterales bacterium]|nr:cobalamin biosynthesis protein CbiA [Desulfobacterales bacterium]
MKLDLNGIVIIAGNYGSGKTESAINLAATRQKSGVQTAIADLDLVNPYFRTREARAPLEELGVNVILPGEQYLHADLPILAPAVAGIIQAPSELTILDAGGDDVGVTVLAALEDVLKEKEVHMLQVINAYRPNTDTVAGCLKIKSEIEASSKVKVTGLVSNANLIDETEPDHIYHGYELVTEVAGATGLPVEFITASTQVLPRLDLDRFHCPVLTIDRKLLPPWKRI